jgi:hypothetical protein
MIRVSTLIGRSFRISFVGNTIIGSGIPRDPGDKTPPHAFAPWCRDGVVMLSHPLTFGVSLTKFQYAQLPQFSYLTGTLKP